MPGNCSRLAAEPAAPAAPEVRMAVLDALATLPPKARVVVVMRYWADLSVNEVAEMLGCSPGNVKSQSSRGLDKLRAVLGDYGWRELRRQRSGMRREGPDMNDPDSGGTALRAMLEHATADEPVIGPVVQNALGGGLQTPPTAPGVGRGGLRRGSRGVRRRLSPGAAARGAPGPGHSGGARRRCTWRITGVRGG